MTPWLVLGPSFFLAAALYASVGHGGASAYLAVFALTGFARPQIATVALALNLFVASTAFLQYRKAGFFAPALLLPFVCASVPAAFVGGYLKIGERMFAGLLAFALIFSALRFLVYPEQKAGPPEGPLQPEASRFLTFPAALRWGVGVPVGLLLGLLAGMVGVGGGIFLSPLLLLLGWAGVKQTAATSAAFIVVNSVAGLMGHAARADFPDLRLLLPLTACVFAGGWAGSYTGAFRLRKRTVRILLGLVLLAASLHLFRKAF